MKLKENSFSKLKMYYNKINLDKKIPILKVFICLFIYLFIFFEEYNYLSIAWIHYLFVI
jgi:hypothetical protein